MTQLQKELQAATEAKEQLQTEQGACEKKVLEQKKAREERLSDSEVKLARTEQKEAYAAEQIQQMESILRDNCRRSQRGSGKQRRGKRSL